jgi:hypothetical protein
MTISFFVVSGIPRAITCLISGKPFNRSFRKFEISKSRVSGIPVQRTDLCRVAPTSRNEGLNMG